VKDKQQYVVSYVESFDEGNEEWTDVTAFSLLDPDEEVEHSFSSVVEAVEFAIQTYGVSRERFISGGMLQTEYLTYWRNKNASL
jgi:predicted esterase